MEIIGIVIGVIIMAFILYKYPGFLKSWLIVSWNLAVGILSIVPGFGWMTHFIITKNKEVKEQLAKDGEQWDLDNQQKLAREAEEREAEAQKETEVYREHYHNGWVDREKMKVSMDGERYYDPDDGQWHNIP